MLQRLPAGAPPTFVTLNPPKPPGPEKTIRQLQMAHPVFSYAAYDAQQKLHTVQVIRSDTLSAAHDSVSLKRRVRGACVISQR